MRVEVTCTVSWLLFRSTKPHDIKTYGSSLTPLSMRVVFSLSHPLFLSWLEFLKAVFWPCSFSGFQQ